MSLIRLDRAMDSWQYRISGTASDGARMFGSLFLETGPGLPVFDIFDARNERAGAILGFPIDLSKRRFVQSDWRSSLEFGAGADRFAEQVLHSFGGPFLLLVSRDRINRIYANCTADIPCVWDCEQGIAASTAHAMFDDASYRQRLNQPLFDELDVQREGWFPAGLTAHHGVERLLPGHYLDLTDWTSHRFWPRAPLTGTIDPVAASDEMATLIDAQMEAVAADPRRFGLALTAGHETRVLLACARPYIDQIDVVTVVGSARHSIDAEMARRITRDMRLRHLELVRRTSDDEQRALYVRRGGHCITDSNARYHPSIWPIAKSHIFVGGLGGEVGRAFLWRDTDRPDTPITQEMLTGRFGLPQNLDIKRRLGEWLANLPSENAYDRLDMAYLEHRMGPWYAAQFCCDPTLLRINPMFTMRGVELMMSLPAEWKRGSRLGPHIIGKLWPELMNYPFNSIGRWRTLLVKAERAIRNPALIVKKFRKLTH